MDNELEWHNKYSDTDEPDRYDRWARICYFKGFKIGKISKIAYRYPAEFTLLTFFPAVKGSKPYHLSTRDNFQAAKEALEFYWERFRNTCK